MSADTAVAWLESEFDVAARRTGGGRGIGPMIGLHAPDWLMTEASARWPVPHTWHDLDREVRDV